MFCDYSHTTAGYGEQSARFFHLNRTERGRAKNKEFATDIKLTNEIVPHLNYGHVTWNEKSRFQAPCWKSRKHNETEDCKWKSKQIRWLRSSVAQQLISVSFFWLFYLEGWHSLICTDMFLTTLSGGFI